VVVVGLGGLGSAAAYRLARRLGEDVLGLEQFEFGHDRGASEDHSRIIRFSYHTPDYVRLAYGAYEAWAQLEAEAGERLLLRTGGLDLWPPDATRYAIADHQASLRGGGVPFELLGADEVRRRWPEWRLDEGTLAIFQPDGGLVDASRANAAHRRLALAHGATLLEHARVTALRPQADGTVCLEIAGHGEVAAAQVVLAADAWTNQLLEPLGAGLPLTVTQEQVTYFASARPEAFAPERFPIWIWMDEPSFYGFPAYGLPGPKVGQDIGGRVVSAETRDFEVDAAAAARVEAFLAEHLPGALGPPLLRKTCLYTLTPDRDFIVDRLPSAPGVLLLQGAAHAYKFAAHLGRLAAELVVDGAAPADLAPFRIERAAIADPNVVSSYYA
jgi:monomeric sarcosine oxidase